MPDSGAARGLLARAERAGRLVENALLCLLLGGLIVLASAQIVLRNVFSMGLPWADGAIRLTVLWLAVLGAVAASREGRHIAIDLLGRFLPKPLALAALVVANVFAALVSGALAYYAWIFVRDSREFGDTLLNGLPAWWFQAILPVGFAILCYRFAWRALVHVTAAARR